MGAYRERHAPVGDCWVVDQSLELGGDGLAAHASLRPAERYPCQGEALHEAMLRVLRNHTPAAIVVDELVDRAAALAAADVGKRGVQLLASAHAREKGATFPTLKAPISVVVHSFRLTFGRAIISRNGLEASTLSLERARVEHSR